MLPSCCSQMSTSSMLFIYFYLDTIKVIQKLKVEKNELCFPDRFECKLPLDAH